MISQLNIVSLYVENQAQAKAFWVEKLGFITRNEGEMAPGQMWIEVLPPGGQTSLSLLQKADVQKNMPGMPMPIPDIFFTTEDARAEFKALQAKGVKVTEVKDEFFGIWFSFYDPDGNSFSVVQPKPMM